MTADNNKENEYLPIPDDEKKILENPSLSAQTKQGSPIHPLNRIDLENMKFENYDLKKIYMECTKFSGSLFINIDLTGAHLKYSKFVNCKMYNVKLIDTDLKKCDFRNCVFQNTFFEKSELCNADLRGADLRGADLKNANLQNADLEGAILYDTNLQDSSLKDAKGLYSHQLRGTNLTGVNDLPEAIKNFESIKIVEEASRNARKLFLGTLLGCAFVLLTVFTTDDLSLITNSTFSPLPIIKTPVPIVLFYLTAPLLLLGAYFYLLLYLQRLWEYLSDLPAFFPDGKPLYKKIYPWLMNIFVYFHFERLKPSLPQFSKTQKYLSILLAWWSVPLTLFFVWMGYLRRHDNFLTYIIHIPFMIISCVAGTIFYLKMVDSLQGAKFRRFFKRDYFLLLKFKKIKFWSLLDKGFWQGKRIKTWFLFILIIIVLQTFYSWEAINGVPWYPKFLQTINLSPVINLENRDISTKPQGWKEKYDPKKDDPVFNEIIGANLKGKNLRYANLNGAFLVKADLSEADLEGAFLNFADLRDAKFWTDKQDSRNPERTNLHNAQLRKADLRNADLRFGYLSGAIFYQADLSGANFEDTILKKACLNHAIINKDTNFPGNLFLTNVYDINVPGEYSKVLLEKGASKIRDYRIWKIFTKIDNVNSDKEWNLLLNEFPDTRVNYKIPLEDVLYIELKKHVTSRFGIDWNVWIKSECIKPDKNWKNIKKAVYMAFSIGGFEEINTYYDPEHIDILD